jgi:[ribosomal protein S5]-alanine N-acetyltransferase
MTDPATFPCITTARLLLREIVKADATQLFAIHGDAQLMKWFGVDPVPDLQGALALVALFANWRILPNPGTRWALQLREDPTLLGTCGLFGWNRTARKCVIGFELAAPAQGQALMNEALRAILSWGFANMELNRIEAQIHPDNQPSIQLARRLGFVQEGRLRQAGYWGGQFNDLLQFSLLRSEWDISNQEPA